MDRQTCLLNGCLRWNSLQLSLNKVLLCNVNETRLKHNCRLQKGHFLSFYFLLSPGKVHYNIKLLKTERGPSYSQNCSWRHINWLNISQQNSVPLVLTTVLLWMGHLNCSGNDNKPRLLLWKPFGVSDLIGMTAFIVYSPYYDISLFQQVRLICLRR